MEICYRKSAGLNPVFIYTGILDGFILTMIMLGLIDNFVLKN